ncbi:MAG: molybdopterin-dependent oxidoreductase [Desulfacinum sp.]|jgi:formate dehydrogenase alpha subunit|nr:molybdopterin-dependent oxidoreductase [Desulfacinum sp.]MBZ4660215.1 formate dehydrogenase subunit alpha [Desulfacinum sp.]
MAKITLKINGQEVQVEEGATILEAANQAGVYIPTLCYHPYLPLEEACRICVVEDVRRGWSTLVAACVFPARQGMVIETDSEKVQESRKTILELLLSDHPNECMTCQATGQCELQDLAYRFRVQPDVYTGERHKLPVDSDPNPFLHIDMNKCVLCRRCIRACHEIQGADIWTKVGRGFEQRISTAFELPLEDAGCEFCGHCADFCPVDAIGFRSGRYQVRSWETRKGTTVCLQCPMGCGVTYEVHNGKVVTAHGDFPSPASGGALCKRGRFNYNFVNTPERLRGAMVQNDAGELEPVPVDQALDTAAARLRDLADQNGGSSVAVLAGDMLTNEEYYLLQKLARGALRTHNVDNVAGPWQLPLYEGLSTSLGLGAMTHPLSDIAQAKSLLVLGSNTLEKHAIAALRARKAVREGAVMIVAHPDQVALTKNAERHLAIRPGSESALVCGFLKVILEEKLYDEGFVEANTQDFDKLQRSLEKISLAGVAEKTGLSEDVLREAARLYASRKPACLIYGADRAGEPADETFYRMCVALQALLGSVALPGGGVMAMGVGGNGLGAVQFGACPKYLPGFRPATQAASRKVASNLWGVEVPGDPGLSWPDLFEAMDKGQIKALYLVGLDPFGLGLPERKVESALAKLQLLIVQDAAKTRAAGFAHVVLPGAAYLEKEGTAVNCERRIQRLLPVMEPPGQARADFHLINGLLRRLNENLALEGPAAAFAEAAQLVKELGAASYETVEGLCWPIGEGGTGTERLLLDGKEKPVKFYAARL